MARRASGISGLVYGISVNVKHTFLRRRKRKKKINGERKPKESECTHRETIPPVCSQKHARVLSKPALLQTSFHCGTRQIPLPRNPCNRHGER